MKVMVEHNVVLKGASIWTLRSALYFNLYFNDSYGTNLINSSLGFRIVKISRHDI